MKTQMLRIIGCSNSSYWYAGKAGQVFRHMGFDLEAGEFITRASDGYINIIKAVDAEVVDVTPSAPTCAVPIGDEVGARYQMVLEIAFSDPGKVPEHAIQAIGRAAVVDVAKFLSRLDIAGTVNLR